MNEKDLKRLLHLERKLYNNEELSKQETKEFEKLFGVRVQQLLDEYYNSL